MASGTISNLGVTYSGATSSLNADLISQLEEADKSSMLQPVKDQLEANFTQQGDLESLMTLVNNVQYASDEFADDLLYLQRTATVTGSGGTVSVDDGVMPQDGDIHVNTLARKSIIQTQGYSARSSAVNLTSETQEMTIKVGDSLSYSVQVTPGMTLEELMQAINDATDGVAQASILNVGGDDPFTMIVKAGNEGVDNAVTIEFETTGNASDTGNENGQGNGVGSAIDLGLTTIQEARDASFTYNGISITRSTNTVDDLITGVTFTLTEEDSDFSFEVERDLSQMSEKMQAFVDSYNELMDFVDEITKYDEDTEESGSFQGDSRISGLRGQLNSLILTLQGDASLVDYGIELTKEGDMTFDAATFQSMMESDPEGLEALFKSESDVTAATMTSGKIGYVDDYTYIIQKDGSIGKNVSSEYIKQDVTIASGAIRINGVSLDAITLEASKSEQENAITVMNAINAISDETGVTATLNVNGDAVVLTEAYGGTIDIEDTDNAAEIIGFSARSLNGSVETTDGIFTKISALLTETVDTSAGALGLLSQSLATGEDRMTEEIDKILARINAKYDTMAQQFSAYNALISSYQAQGNAIQQQIDAMAAASS